MMMTMKVTLQNQLVNHGFHLSECAGTSNGQLQIPLVHAKIRIIEHSTPTVQPNFAQLRSGFKEAGKMCATRRRRSYLHSESDDYVLLEPGQSEEFVSEEELKGRLKGWLENWPGKALPTDLSKFDSVDDAVSFLVKSVCELEIDGDVGSIQWYQVRLE